MSSCSSMERVHEDKVLRSLDLVDSLRSVGAEEDLALPCIAVIGDENSGKRTVLEALSGVALPRDREYPLVIKLRKAKLGEWCGKVRYQQSERNNERIIQQNDDLAKKIKEVQSYYFSNEHFITLEITSPNVPDLTLVDLPSIPTEESDEETFQIKKFITKPETIILMVLPCNEDIASTEALNLAQEVDPNGERTWGILTKPDLADEAKEKTIVHIVQNNSLPLAEPNTVTSRLAQGFIIVRCWGQTQMSPMDRINKEKQFFNDHAVFKSLNEDGHATVPKVAERLSQELIQLIEKFVPRLKEEIKRQLPHTYTELKRYGDDPPSDEADRLTFLNTKVTSFTQDVIKLTSGELLELIVLKVHSAWTDIVDSSHEAFQLKLELEVAQYEQKYADRKPGLSYKTFEHVIKDQIKLLEEPAVLILTNISEMAKKALCKQGENSFFGFTRLISDATSTVRGVISRSQKAAEFFLRTQFKMELFGAHTEGTTNSKTFGKPKSPVAQINSYYQNACQHLARQIPLVIQFHILQESCTQIQKEMLQKYNDKPDTYRLLQKDSKISEQKKQTQKHFMRLTEARILLSGF